MKNQQQPAPKDNPKLVIAYDVMAKIAHRIVLQQKVAAQK